MVYRVEFTNKAYKIAKKPPHDVRNAIVDHSQKIASNPHTAPKLEGKYSFLRSYHLTFKGTAYRIIYQVFDKRKMVLIRLADTRENIYRQLDRMKVKRAG